MLVFSLILAVFGLIMVHGKTIEIVDISFHRGDECLLWVDGEQKKFTFYGYDKCERIVLLKDDEGKNFKVSERDFKNILVK